MMRPISRVVIVLFAFVGATACVRKSTYETAMAKLKQAETDRAAAQAELAAAQEAANKQHTQLKGTLDAAAAEKARLESEFAADKQATLAELQELRKQRAAIEKSLAAWRSITGRFQKMIDAGKLKVEIRRGRMIVQLPSSVLFASGKDDLSDPGKEAIAEVATVLKDFPDRKFLVTGHTDSVPIKSAKYADNWELSTARSLTVTKFLIENGIKPTNLIAGGYGEYDPIGNNQSPPGRQKNRRIEIILLPNIEEMPSLPESK